MNFKFIVHSSGLETSFSELKNLWGFFLIVLKKVNYQ